MLKFSRSFLIIGLLLMAACQTGPKPEPAPEPEVAEVEAGVDAAQSQAEPEPEPEPIDYAQQIYQQAIQALKNGDYEVAVEILLEISAENPDKPFVFTNLGLAYLKLENTDEARDAFERAVEADDDDAVAHNHLGILHRQKGEFENARQRYQRAIDINAKYARAHLNLGILFDIYLQDLDKALAQYETYQSLTTEEDAQVAGWIVDIQRRIKSSGQSQG